MGSRFKIKYVHVQFKIWALNKNNKNMTLQGLFPILTPWRSWPLILRVIIVYIQAMFIAVHKNRTSTYYLSQEQTDHGYVYFISHLCLIYIVLSVLSNHNQPVTIIKWTKSNIWKLGHITQLQFYVICSKTIWTFCSCSCTESLKQTLVHNMWLISCTTCDTGSTKKVM